MSRILSRGGCVSHHALVGCVSQHALGRGCVSQHGLGREVWQTPPPGRQPRDRHLPLGRHHPWQTPPLADTTLGRHHPGQTLPGQVPPGQTCPPTDGHCSGRYASYWNAFLFFFCLFSLKSETRNRSAPSLDLGEYCIFTTAFSLLEQNHTFGKFH